MSSYLNHDVQSETTGFKKIEIKKVGVRKIKIPISVIRKDNTTLNTIAHISAYCNLSSDVKGINMSRNARVLIEHLASKELHFHELREVTEQLAKAHETTSISLRVWFEYLFNYSSPITKHTSLETCIVKCTNDYKDNVHKTYLQVISNESSCCPCSKNMSMLSNNLTESEHNDLDKITNTSLRTKIMNAGFGAHNQRSEIDITVELNENKTSSNIMWIEDLVTIAKKSASAETFNVLKRPDEKYVTELQYLGGYFNDDGDFIGVEGAGPKFVEDIARDAAAQLFTEIKNKRINDFVVVVNNEESIHTSLLATAIIDAGKDLH